MLWVAFIRCFAYNVPIWSKGNRGNRIPFCRCAVDPVKIPDAEKRGSGVLLRRSSSGKDTCMNNSNSVDINGNKIRLIREQKGLTQLYLATVVGVTTDTISRWENRRYPSIKLDNARKLAEALEVSLDELLENEGKGASPTCRRASSRLWPTKRPIRTDRHFSVLLVRAVEN